MNQQKAVLAMFCKYNLYLSKITVHFQFNVEILVKKYTWTLPKDSIHKNGVITKGLFLLSVVDMKLVLSPR